MPFLHRASLGLSLAARAYRTPVCFGTNAIVEQPGGTVVLVRHRYMPGLCFPGGGVEAGEPPLAAVQRELREEIGVTQADSVEFLGLYTRKVWWTTNVITLFRVRGAELNFKPGLEISDIILADPHAPPADTAPGARRRLAELTGKAPVSLYW
ncbi:MAG TPA: NUDIX domain-containing protein [Rhizomicrobium sp.]|nr:NUDIX domain-containing protein [Rhizomicrobium sp.]